MDEEKFKEEALAIVRRHVVGCSEVLEALEVLGHLADYGLSPKHVVQVVLDDLGLAIADDEIVFADEVA